MPATRTVRLTPRAERRAIVALFAIFALLVQALLPMAAAASPLIAGNMICSSHGVQQAPADSAPGKSAPMRGCEHCACPVAFAAAPPAGADIARPVRFPAPAPQPVLAQGQAPGRGLAAPPPPSQGPPSFWS